MTIYDIAKKANVSTATVSRVLNNSNKVKDKTRKRILAIIEQEGFTPNIFARGLGLRSIQMIGILCTDVSDIFYALAVSCLEREMSRHGFNSILCCTGNELEGKQNKVNLLLEKQVDAIILVGSTFNIKTDDTFIRKAAEKTPILIINGELDMPNVYSVLCDEHSIAASSTMKLFDSGCKNVLFIYDYDTSSNNNKKAGYLQAFEERNIPKSNDLIVRAGHDFDSIDVEIGKLCERNVPFDAVLGSDDFMAIGVQKALKRRNIDVPLIGFDNSILALSASPTLTSIDNHLEDMCIAAVDILIKVFGGEDVQKCTIFNGTLVERETFKFKNT